MKILYISQSYPPMISGASLAAAQLAEGIAKKGHDVLVIAASDREKGYTTLSGNLRIERLPSHHNPARVGQRFLLWPRRRLHALAEDFNPDIIHCHEPMALGICGLRVARRRNVPVVLTIHQLPWFVTKYTPTLWGTSINFEWALWQYARWFLRQCAASIVPTRTIAGVVKQHTGQIPQIIPYAIDLVRFNENSDTNDETDRLRCQYGIRADKPVILHVGRLDLDKDVDYVVQAAARAMQQVDAELLIVGDGCQRPALINQCEELEIAERCHFTGFISPNGDLPTIYKLARVFVTASEIETFGIVILEAMASACPVVAVRATCIPELVDDRYSGFLVQPKDVGGLAEKIIWLLENPEQAQTMGQRGWRISQQYDRETMLRKHLSLYHSIQRQCYTFMSLPPQRRAELSRLGGFDLSTRSNRIGGQKRR